MNWKTFFICGLTGWCMEILFTSLGGLLRGDLLLNGHTSIWMFPIYGLVTILRITAVCLNLLVRSIPLFLFSFTLSYAFPV